MILSQEKPTSTGSLIGNPSAVASAKEWASKWQSRQRQAPLLVYGPVGTGKTALAHAIAAEFGWDLFEFNASDMRDAEAVGGVLANAASSGSLFSRCRLILIDDVDSLSGRQDRGGANAIAKALLQSRQPVMLTALSLYDKKLQPIRALCQPLELRKIQASSIAKLLKSIASERKLPIGLEQIEKIAAGSGGDVRAALNDLQGQNPSASRDSPQNIFEVLRAILKSEKYSEARKAAFSSDVDHDTLKLWVAQNIPAEYEKPFDIAEAFHFLSRADIFDGRISRSQYYGYLRYSNDLLSSGVALAKASPYRKYTPIGFPDYLREMGASKGSRALRKGVLRKISLACHCSLVQSQSYLPVLEAMAAGSPAGVASEFGFEEEELLFVAKKAAAPKKGPVKKPAKG